MGTVQIDGSTPKITVGNATAEDATILFDGNAQDFYIALDDSADDLLIGLGSTVGTTPIIAIDENKLSTFSGAITVGVDDTGHDVKLFGASAGAYMEWDESADQLRIMGASADATTSTGKLLLATSLTDINANDVIGKIEFQAPHEAGGTDAITVAASIQAVAQGTFTSSVNATDLIFYTGHSEAAAEKIRITSQNEIGIAGANYGTDGQVLTSGGAGAAVAWEDAASTLGGLTDVSMDITNFVDGLLIQTDTDGSAPGTGTLSSATGNIGIGKDVFAALTSGDYNVVIGYQAGDVLNSGGDNVFIGINAGGANTSGARNIYIGKDAGLTLVDPAANIAIGAYAMDGATDTACPENIAIGESAMSAALASGATQNIALGVRAFEDLTTSKYSTAVGHQAGMNVTTGFGNTCIGHQAGNVTITGDYNTFLGIGANGSANNTTRAIAIGQDVTAASNDFSFGKSGSVVTNDFDTDADWAQSSDERLKRNIEDSTLGLDFINDLRPRKFQWEPYSEVPEELRTNWEEGNEKNLDATMHGFIAQEVKTAIDTHGDTTFGGWQLDKVDGVTQRTKKSMFIMPLIKAVQELSTEVETLKAKVAVLEG